MHISLFKYRRCPLFPKIVISLRTKQYVRVDVSVLNYIKFSGTMMVQLSQKIPNISHSIFKILDEKFDQQKCIN